MNPLKIKARSTRLIFALCCLSLAFLSQSSNAQVVVPALYSYSLAPNHRNGGTSYQDPSLTKLTDDVSPSGGYGNQYAGGDVW